MTSVLLLIDFINDIVTPGGKSGDNGYAEFAARHGTLEALQLGSCGTEFHPAAAPGPRDDDHEQTLRMQANFDLWQAGKTMKREVAKIRPLKLAA